ncbi:DUF4974 domain-containing protein [Chitinophaga agrisoli]|uniref:DUF4974 domain-containing protein n=1 Tax=Chitinophaga agrisoli TaxID=2607653 RepID=A0A5B2VKP3_9BACT|nr:FecR domain-containing protein [Chitinophaga agrisoli]KAA2240183.1 DUF4974 domain-containing protein [Chitinophaga agrisoli]
MNFLDQIENLTGQEIANIISDEDRKFLQQSVANDPAAYAVWKERHDFHAREDIQEWKAAYNPEEVLNRILPDVQKSRKKVFNIRLATSVAATILAVIGGIYLSKFFIKQKPSIVYSSRHNIELQMPGGEKIDLSTSQGQVPVGAMTLHNLNKTLRYSTTNTNDEHLNLATLTVPAGKDYKIELSDGSEVWLNSATTLKFPFTFAGASREISISGEAYIKVSHNESKPFLVHLPNSTIQVLGTEFNINTYTDGVERVALVKGAVKVQGNGKHSALKPGFESVIAAGDIQVRPFYADEVLSWRQGIYYFDNTTLGEVCKVIPRWFGVEVVIDDPKISQKRFTGLIDRNKPMEKSLELLKAFNDIQYSFDKQGVLHIR